MKNLIDHYRKYKIACKVIAEYTPATISSNITENGEWSFSSIARIPSGFRMSKNRNITKANSTLTQEKGTKSIVIHTPIVSSITILPGSCPHSGSKILALHVPKIVNRMIRPISRKSRFNEVDWVSIMSNAYANNT